MPPSNHMSISQTDIVQVKEAAAAKIKKQAEDEVSPLTYENVDAVELRPWKTTSHLTTDGKLGEVEAQ